MTSGAKPPRVRRFSVRGRDLRIREAPGVHPVDAVARRAIGRLPVRPGDSVLDVGCGTGIYGLAAALLDAPRVVLTDLDPRAVRCARANARDNRVRGVELLVGDLFRPVQGRKFDLIIANLPQTPGPRPFTLAKWGGPDGTLHLCRLIREAPRHLRAGGRLFFLHHELANRPRILKLLERRFQVRTALRVRREFTPAEYEGYLPGLTAYLERMRRRGASRFHGRDALPAGSGRSPPRRDHRTRRDRGGRSPKAPGGRRWFVLRILVARLRSG